MRFLSCAATVFFLLLRSSNSHSTQAMLEHTRLSEQTRLSLGSKASTVAAQIAQIGHTNHIPVGLVVEPNQRGLCSPLVPALPDAFTVGELMDRLNQTIPTYHADLRDGVLTVLPRSSNLPVVDNFLALRMPSFRTQSDGRYIMGITLWYWIRALIAPSCGTGFAGGVPSNPDLVPGFTITNGTVLSALDKIADSGKGGIWILEAAKLKDISPNTPMPYGTYSYGEDDAAIARSVSCRSTGNDASGSHTIVP